MIPFSVFRLISAETVAPSGSILNPNFLKLKGCHYKKHEKTKKTIFLTPLHKNVCNSETNPDKVGPFQIHEHIFKWNLSPNWPARSAKQNFGLFFQSFEWICFKMFSLYLNLFPNWPARSAKENFWLFFQFFEWICFKMLENPPI